jgi:alcohol dehydrogenase class IV
MALASIRLGGENLIIGPDALSWLAQVKGRHAVIVSSRSIVQFGYYDQAVKLLNSAGLNVEGYFDYGLNPSFEEALKGAKFLINENPDLLIAIGGGTVMDIAKLMWVLYENVYIDTLDELRLGMDSLVLGKKAKFICIPTTSGSASEVSKSSVITDSISKKKVPIRNLAMVPTIAILDPKLTLSLPRKITAETGMDALAHHLESLVSIHANPISDALARSAAIDAIEWLPIAYEDGSNLIAREKMMFVSTMGGLAFSAASLGLSHGIAHAIGARLEISHGILNSILLPRIIRFNYENNQAFSKYLSVSRHFGSDDLSQIIIDLRKRIELPATIRQVVNDDQFFEDQLTAMIQDVGDDGLTKLNCVQPNSSQIKELLQAAYYGY